MGPETPVAAAVYRGETIESLHRAHVVVADPNGWVLASSGSPQHVVFSRSSIKAYQLAPLVASGAADRFGFDERELAVMCSSHSAEELHLRLVRGILERIGLNESHLQCGFDGPYDPAKGRSLDGPLTPLHHNCSGKHANLLAQAVDFGADVATYLHPDHPVQNRILAWVARGAGLPPESLARGTDGCSAPNYAFSMATGARLFATLAKPEGLGGKDADALLRIRAAMMKHPELVAGTDRFDTRLMQAGKGRIAGKIGGEGVFGVAHPETGLGLYVKVEDGNSRAIPPITLAALDQLGWLDAAATSMLDEQRSPPVTNARGLKVGRIQPTLRLDVSNLRKGVSTTARP